MLAVARQYPWKEDISDKGRDQRAIPTRSLAQMPDSFWRCRETEPADELMKGSVIIDASFYRCKL